MSPRALGYAIVGLGAASWGLNGVMARLAIDLGLPPLQGAQARVLGMGLVMFGTALVLGNVRRLDRDEFVPLARLGLFTAVAQACYVLAIARLDVGLTATIVACSPFFVAAWMRLRHREVLGHWVLVGMAVTVFGAALLVGGARGGTVTAAGLVLAVAATIADAGQLTQATHSPQAVPLSLRLATSMAVASVVLALVAPPWLFRFDVLGSPGDLFGSATPVWGLILMSVAAGGAGYAAIVRGSPNIGASATSMMIVCEPIVASIGAWFVLDQRLTALQIAGIGIAMTGLLVAEGARSGMRRAVEP